MTTIKTKMRKKPLGRYGGRPIIHGLMGISLFQGEGNRFGFFNTVKIPGKVSRAGCKGKSYDTVKKTMT